MRVKEINLPLPKKKRRRTKFRRNSKRNPCNQPTTNEEKSK